MRAIGAFLIVAGVLAGLFSGQIPGFEGKNVTLGLALALVGAGLLAWDYFQTRPRDIKRSHQTVVDSGNGAPVVQEEASEIKHS